LRIVRGETTGPAASAARAALGFASVAYRAGVASRNAAYDLGLSRVGRATVPVVSVGNLTLGGTGKTPAVEWVARWYRRRSVRVAVLSRGYGREGQGGAVNDEAMVLEENLPDVPHLQNPDRLASAAVAVEELDSEVLILDDGFQHRRLARELDIVLIDALDPFGLGRMFPRGLLRESVRSLRRAGVVVVTRADLVETQALEGIRTKAERAAGPLRWVLARHAPLGLVAPGVAEEPVAGLAKRSVAAFCGIGNPEGFRRTIAPLCGNVTGFRTFPDHHPYSSADVADLTRWADSLGAQMILTTQKDLVKLRTAALGGVPLRALKVGLELLEGAAVLDAALAAVGPGSRGGGGP
jgi:tetraacyldisaccharide 4'-kinase